MEEQALESRIDELYQLEPTDFVSSRNALAKTLASAGNKEAAQRVKKLTKATLTAWAVNRVVGGHQRAFLRAVEAGEHVRAALAGKGSIPDAMAARRSAVDALTKAAVSELEAAGGKAGPDTVRRLSRSIEALVTAPVDGVVAGRLTHDLDPPGFEAVMGMALAVPADSPPRRRKPGTQKRSEGPAARKGGKAASRAARKGGKAASRATSRKPGGKDGKLAIVSPRAKGTTRPTLQEHNVLSAESAKGAAAQDRARQGELRAARSAGLKGVREARSKLEAAERRQAAAARSVERTQRARAAAQAELDRAAQAAEEAREHLTEEEARVGECRSLVDRAQEALDALDSGDR